MASAPNVAAESVPQWPAMAVETMPISGTVMFDTMLGSAMRMISRFIFILFCGGKIRIKNEESEIGLPFPHRSEARDGGNVVPRSPAAPGAGFNSCSCGAQHLPRAGRATECPTFLLAG